VAATHYPGVASCPCVCLRRTRLAPAQMGIACSSGQIVPRWAAVSLSAFLAGTLTAALGWLGLAIVGLLSTPAAIALAIFAGGPTAALTARAVLGHPTTTASSRSRSRWWVAAIVVAVAASVWNGINHAEHLVVERDPGVYLVTARWLSDHRSLHIDGPTGAFENEEGIRPVGAGFYGGRGDGGLEAQFAHLTPAVVGVVARIGGDILLFVTNAVLGGIGLVLVFAVAATLMPPRWAFVAMSGLAASFPFIYFSRDLYSEPLAMILLFGGFFVWELASMRPDILLGFVAGSLIGASCVARIDGFISVIPATAVFALYIAGGGAPGDRGPPLRRVGIAALVAMAAVAAFGWFDVRYFSTGYYITALEPRLGSMLLAAAVAGPAAVLAARVAWRRKSAQLTLVAKCALLVGTVVAGAAALYARFIRPDPSAVEAALADGWTTREIDPLAYTQSMEWLEWYLGPVVLALGVAGLIALIWKGLQTPGPRSSLLFSSVVVATTIVYLREPNITAVQVWAMRRFLPLTLPGLLIAAAWVLAQLVSRWHGPRWYQMSAWVVGAIALVLPTALLTWPLRDVRVEVPMRRGVDAVCEAAGPDAAILVSGPGQTVITLPQSLRAFCGVPTGGDGGLSAADVRRLEDEWAQEGRHLVVVSPTPNPYDGIVAREKDHVFGARVEHPDEPRTRAPSRIEPDRRLQLTPDQPVYHLWVLESFDDAS
jgi:hypothetical protein